MNGNGDIARLAEVCGFPASVWPANLRSMMNQCQFAAFLRFPSGKKDARLTTGFFVGANRVKKIGCAEGLRDAWREPLVFPTRAGMIGLDAYPQRIESGTWTRAEPCACANNAGEKQRNKDENRRKGRAGTFGTCWRRCDVHLVSNRWFGRAGSHLIQR